ncbi:RHTO0S03e05578g2_1 [Rhodotorula toruloides]|uniref:RHTO0S03e05578g2_1 n=1 Tax=Rhodotorula toruloides TaxID=5286 RepID=A0A061AS45_RHOTO|nr:RHTO0S03e05578g2_1 [Rhodotorula toruloides]
MPSTSSLLPSTDFTFDGLPASPAPGGDFAALRHFRTYTPSDSTSPLGPGLLSVAGLLAALQPHTATLAGTQADKDSVAKPAVTSVRQREKADDQVGRAGTSSQAKRKGRAEPVDDEDESSQAAGRIPESEGGREELRNSSSDGGQVRIGAARWLLRHRGWTSRVCGFVPSPAQPGQYDRRPYNQGRNDQATAQRGRWVIETRPAAERAPLWNVCAQHWPQEVTGSTLGESYRLLVASQASSPSSLDSVRDRKRATSAADGVERPTKRPKPARLIPATDPSWSGFTLNNPFKQMPNGLVVRFPVSPKLGMLSSQTLEEQAKRLSSIVELNEDNGCFNWMLRPYRNQVEKLLPLAPALSCDVLEPPTKHPLAFQPIDGTPLNLAIASQDVPFLAYYGYLHELYAPTMDVAERWMAFITESEQLAMAREADCLCAHLVYADGLKWFKRNGGWSGEKKRVGAYSGWSVGRDSVVEGSQPSVRAYAHFTTGRLDSNVKVVLSMVAKFNAAHSDAPIEVVGVFTGSAINVDPQGALNLSDGEIMTLEPLTSAARFTGITHGGLNAISCGSVYYYDDLVTLLYAVPRGVKLSALPKVPGFPSSAASVLLNRHPATMTVHETILALQVSQRRREMRKDGSKQDQVPRRERLQKKRFRKGRGPLSVTLNLGKNVVDSLLRRFPRFARTRVSEAVDLPESLMVQIRPFESEPFFPTLSWVAWTSYRRGTLQDDFLGGIISAGSIRVGVRVRLQTNSRQTLVRMILCEDDTAILASFNVALAQAADEAWLWWDDEEKVFYASADEDGDELLQLKSGAWQWDKETVVGRINPSISLKGEERKSAGEAAKEMMESILH